MPVTFKNAPLVELIAELRWNPTAQGAQLLEHPSIAAPTFISMNTTPFEEFFMRFGANVHQQGFQRAERVSPAGFPVVAFQPVFRFRQPPENNAAVLYQVGAGLFSANAVPPYRTWNDFVPVVERGVAALLASRGEEEKNTPFISTSVRYIDAFRAAITQGQEVAAFIEKSLGISISLPEALTKNIADGRQHKPFLQLQLPMPNDMSMNLGIGEGLANKEPAIIMDTTVVTTMQVAATVNDVMCVMHAAHDAIHRVFFELTASIQHLMQPAEEKSE